MPDFTFTVFSAWIFFCCAEKSCALAGAMASVPKAAAKAPATSVVNNVTIHWFSGVANISVARLMDAAV